MVVKLLIRQSLFYQKWNPVLLNLGQVVSPSFNKDLGNIKLVTDFKQLQDVTITSESPSVRLNTDKKIFNVE